MQDDIQRAPRTVADHFEATKIVVSGASDPMVSRRQRICSVIVDGRPLGEYELDVPRDKQAAKQFVEMQWLAIVLVGCDVDRDIREVRTLPPGSSATPDFEATLHDGRTVRIELTRVVDEDERRYLAALGGIAANARALLKAKNIDDATGGGEFFLRFYDAPAPTAADMVNAAHELLEFISHDQRLRSPSTTLWKATASYPTLDRLGAHVCHLNRDGPTRIEIDPSRQRGSRNAVIASFEPIVAKKKENVTAYSDGNPVWLAVYVDTRLFYPLGVIQSLSEVETFDPLPFARVLVGCPTAGVIFERPNVKPTYTSLSETE